MASIHPSAHVEDGATIGDGVEIGPFSVIGPDVAIGAGTRIHSHVVITGHTTLGPSCDVYPFTTLGEPPQDIKYRGEPTRLEVGAGTLIREHVTIHRGTPHGGNITRVGSNCFFMVNAHIAHDCVIGDNVIIINQAMLAGHCEIGDYAIIGAVCALQQFTRVGKHAFLAAQTGLATDVIPFGIAKGGRHASRHPSLHGLNLVGLRRRGFTRDEILALRESYRILFSGPNHEIADRARRVGEKFAGIGPVGELVRFITERPERNLCLPDPENAKIEAEGL
jgi:UDP-N-acetylglucosamine acyltransferase